MRVLVTGGAGFLGRHLSGALTERGDEVRILDRPGAAAAVTQPDVEVFEGDITRAESLSESIRGVEGVIHLAALSGVWRSPAEYHAVNVLGTENVCRAALRARVKRLVHISSWTVYGMGIGRQAHEGTPLSPLDEPYSVSKMLGDRLVQRMIAEDGLPAVIIRPDTIVGPGDEQHVGRIADRLLAGRTIIVGNGTNAMPLVYVTDVVKGLLQALDSEHAAGRIYNIGNHQPLTQQEVLGAIAAEVGASPPRLHVPYGTLYSVAAAAEAFARLTHTHPLITRLGVAIFGADNRHSIDRARRELGYAPAVNLSEGIHRTCAWYRHERRRGQVSEAARAGSRV
jgi:nucleoside-diphosphate-sugar epimerase